MISLNVTRTAENDMEPRAGLPADGGSSTQVNGKKKKGKCTHENGRRRPNNMTQDTASLNEVRKKGKRPHDEDTA